MSVKDLRRPFSIEDAERLVAQYSRDEDHPLFKRDFYQSLLASFTLEEVEKQISAANLSHYLTVQSLGDRHLLISGILEYEKGL